VTHEVAVLCNCSDIELCHLERYVADIRSLLALYGDPLTLRPKRKIDARDNVITVRPEGDNGL
jgi:hypothetical protein